jgi:chromate transporter
MSLVLFSLANIFFTLAFLAFGGGNTILPEIQKQVVTLHHWMSAEEFGYLFAVARAAPGPNMMIVPLVGWKVAGIRGLLVSAIANFIPSALITMLTMKLWRRFKDQKWRRVMQVAIRPITVGLVISSAWLMSSSIVTSLPMLVIFVLAALVPLFKSLHPLLILSIGTLVGVFLH